MWRLIFSWLLESAAWLLDACRKILYKRLDSADILELLRTSLANLPSDYSGFNQYWQSASTQSDR
jgi:hypothetical protein